MHGKILIIVGPTAIGKSALAVNLARRFGGEVISADSRQVYKGLDIGTGKMTKKEMRGVPHHLLDVSSPKRQFTVAEYKKLAHEKLLDIQRRGKLPILVGGTGLYIDTLFGRFTIPEVPPNLKLRKQLEEKSPAALFSMLQKLDARRATTIDRHNPRRLIRAIEIADALGKVPHQRHPDKLENVGVFKNAKMMYIGLTLPKNELKEKIAERLAARLKDGMTEEARRLHRWGLSWKRMEALGLEYRCLARFLQKKITREGMIEQLEKEIGHYAKRQMTWFKRNTDIRWFSPKERNQIESEISRFLRR